MAQYVSTNSSFIILKRCHHFYMLARVLRWLSWHMRRYHTSMLRFTSKTWLKSGKLMRSLAQLTNQSETYPISLFLIIIIIFNLTQGLLLFMNPDQQSRSFCLLPSTLLIYLNSYYISLFLYSVSLLKWKKELLQLLTQQETSFTLTLPSCFLSHGFSHSQSMIFFPLYLFGILYLQWKLTSQFLGVILIRLPIVAYYSNAPSCPGHIKDRDRSQLLNDRLYSCANMALQEYGFQVPESGIA